MKYIRSPRFYPKLIGLLVIALSCLSCNTSYQEEIDHPLTGKIISIDSVASKDFSFVMQLDSSGKQAFVISSDEISLSPSKLKLLTTGQHVKVKGSKIIYIRNGSKVKDAANVIVINQLDIIDKKS